MIEYYYSMDTLSLVRPITQTDSIFNPYVVLTKQSPYTLLEFEFPREI